MVPDGRRHWPGSIAACASGPAGQSLTCPLCRTAFGAKAVLQAAEAGQQAAAVAVAEQALAHRDRLRTRLEARRRLAGLPSATAVGCTEGS